MSSIVIDSADLPEVIYDADKQEIYIESTDPLWSGHRQTRHLNGADFAQEIRWTRMMVQDGLAILQWFESDGAQMLAEQTKLTARRDKITYMVTGFDKKKYADLPEGSVDRNTVDHIVKLETELEELREFRSRVPEVIA